MADYNDRYDSDGGGAGFIMGLLTGTVLGAGLGMLLAPKAGSELRGALGEQARTIGSMAQEQYKKASDSANTWADKGREFVDRTRDAVNRGAEEAREYTESAGSTAAGQSPTRPTGGDFGRS
jgi:gas vesicle protein